MSTPAPLRTYRDTFCATQASAAAGDAAILARASLRMPNITSSPLPTSARRTAGSASKSLTLAIPLARMSSTMRGAGIRCADTVPQFTPIAASVGHSKAAKNTTNATVKAAAIGGRKEGALGGGCVGLHGARDRKVGSLGRGWEEHTSAAGIGSEQGKRRQCSKILVGGKPDFIDFIGFLKN
jgi:hypothetical protein